MTKYHINSKGEPGKCSASVGTCPYGDGRDHYPSEAAAREAYELKMGNDTTIPPAVRSAGDLAFDYGRSLKEEIRHHVANVGAEVEWIDEWTGEPVRDHYPPEYIAASLSEALRKANASKAQVTEAFAALHEAASSDNEREALLIVQNLLAEQGYADAAQRRKRNPL